MNVFTKTPVEERTVPMSYANRLPSGVTVQSSVVTAYDIRSGDDATADLIITPQTSTTSTTVVGWVQAGDDGADYRIDFTTVLSNGEVVVDSVLLRVREVV